MDVTILTNQMIAERAGWFVVRDHGFDEWYPPDYDANTRPGYHTDVPMYLESVDAALTLLPLVGGEWFSWELRPAGIDLMYVCEIIDFTRRWKGEADTPAAAICKAWWAWQESQ